MQQLENMQMIETILKSIKDMPVGWADQTSFDIAVLDCLTYLKRLKESL